MNSGVIIIFLNNEKEIDNNEIEKLLDLDAYNVCFVNNGSTDNTLHLLQDIKFKLRNKISIVDIKHEKELKSAIKAGARSLRSESSEYDFIVYLNSNMLDYLESLNDYFTNIKANRKELTPMPSRSQRNVLKDVFSISELLKNSNANEFNV